MMKAISVIVVRDAYTTVLVLGGTVIVVVCSSLRIASWRMSQFQLLALLLLTREAFRPMERLLNEFHEAHAGGAAAGSIMKVLGEPPLIRENAATCKVTCGSRVEFRDVSFSYSAGAQVLNSVAFRVEDGETVALVGPSGAGKSTVVALLLRFFDPNTGSIFIGDVNIRDLALNALRRRVGVVSQDIHLFYGSILDNIRMGAREANLDTVIAAATAANAHEFIQGLPMGYDTIVGERGAQLSGGQRQRLAIARAILKDAPILVLDEATSSLDAESERAVQEAMGRLTIGRTVLVVAHRLSTIRGADRILILDRGSIVEAGTHAELMAKRGRYAKLAFTQEGAA
jgi:ABC-type multidrug transport system fused ATPase/permease subunit